MYLKEWATVRPDSIKQRIIDLIVKKRFGLNHRHDLFLCLLYNEYFRGREIKAIDIGAGNGYALSYDNPLIEKYAIDTDNHFEMYMHEKNINFIQHDLEHYNMKEIVATVGSKLDLIIMNHVIEHIYFPNKLLSEIDEILNPGGIIYLRTPDVEKFKFEFFNDYTHVRPFTKSSVSQLFRTKSFEVLKIRNTSSSLFYVNAFNPPELIRILLRIDKLGRDVELIARKPMR